MIGYLYILIIIILFICLFFVFNSVIWVKNKHMTNINDKIIKIIIYINFIYVSLMLIFISYLFERNICDLKITNKYTVKWNSNLFRHITNIEPNIYEINLKLVFLLNEFTNDSLKAFKSILHRLRYIDKKKNFS